MWRPIVDSHGKTATRNGALGGLWVLVLMLLAAPARAQSPAEACSDSPRSFITMETPPPSASAPVAWPEVVRHVRSELALRQIGLCTAPQGKRPLGRLRLESRAPSSLHISLWAEDLHELLGERSLDLAPIPSDARLLSIAVTADELLAANVAELERRAERARAAERQPAQPVKPRTPAQPHSELGPGFVYESFNGGQTLLGVDARLGVKLIGPLGMTARVGFRQGLPRQSDHGSLHGSAWLGGLGLRLTLAGSERFELDLLGRIDAMRLSASAFAEAGATARSDAGVAVLLGAGPAVTVVLSRSLRLVLDATAGAAVRPVHITDTGRRVSGVSGLAMSLGGGVLATF